MHHCCDVITVRHDLQSIKKNTHYSVGQQVISKEASEKGDLKTFTCMLSWG